jgi:lipid II:glycine glycyltransferase (peptidoglycan interpeptide bridge formation enzyme)
VRFGKRLGLREFDLWGAMGPNPDPNDSWFGFHTFKERFGPEHGVFVGSYDLVIDPVLYQGYKLADKLRWLYLRMKR